MKRLSILLSALVLVACGNDGLKDLREFVQNAGAGMRGQVAPPPEVKPYQAFNYDNAAGLPDPFKPRKQDMRQGGRPGLNQPDLERRREMLEEYPLESLKMVGYMQKGGVGYAVVRSPDGRIHRVTKGNYLGQNFGQIRSISDAGVDIREMVQDSGGDWSERISTLQLME
ncbi:MAG: pilus assembly protein PilP [Nitrosomonadales bacterium]|nr:pilus assembly protein PilP [Nitrosomonadales bacterium]